MHASLRRLIVKVLCGLLLLASTASLAQDQPPLRIGIIGTGAMGSALARLWVEAGHEVMMSSRHPEQLQSLADELGERARIGTPAQAADYGDVILLTVPYGATPQVGRDHGTLMAGKVLLDAGNPRPERDGPMAEQARSLGSGLASQRFLAGTRLVKAFNAISAYRLRSEAHRDGDRLAIPLASDDEQALEVAAQLVEDAGFDPVIVGPLASAKRFDFQTGISARSLTAPQLREALGL
ncbi:NADPH-dependent F420 reductase [Pseudomonas sp. PS1]|uniref:NADPH-dependent F420 reductase n=1 Tax=Stutzerimonas marianensis TaxID=2929513 RepID=A0A9X1W5Y2_9GAMM|nr:NADPH-dependent F420 reductase [Pseudomonas marianensis]MCJ0975926.1 NADPH-dependent F420 reductase [Pseudomonas marianensis]